MARGLFQEREGAVVVLEDGCDGPTTMVVAVRTVGVDVEVDASRYECEHAQGKGNRIKGALHVPRLFQTDNNSGNSERRAKGVQSQKSCTD